MNQEKGSMIRGRDRSPEIEDIIRIRRGEKILKVEDIIEHTLEIGQDFQETIEAKGHSLGIEEVQEITEEEVFQRVEIGEIVEINQEIGVKRCSRSVLHADVRNVSN